MFNASILPNIPIVAQYQARLPARKRKTLRFQIFLMCAALAAMLGPSLVVAQAVSSLPREEYYLAKGFFGNGRTVEAQEGFQVAMRRARQVGNLRWVDSVPPLVMLGECFYRQGNLRAAMEQYDAALMLVMQNPNWIYHIDVGTEQLSPFDSPAKGIDWFGKSKAFRPVEIPEAVQIAVDPNQIQEGPQGELIASISLLTRLDATEVMRTMGIALYRRWQILGPLAKLSPLSAPMSQYFDLEPQHQLAWVQQSWLVLRGLSRLSTHADADALGQLRRGTWINGDFSYFLSPLALLATAELEAGKGNYQAAIRSVQDASLIAAGFEQHSELAWSMRDVGAHACASARYELLESMQKAAAWASKRSPLAYAATLLAAAELSVYAGDFSLSDRMLKQVSGLLRPRDVVLPRLDAQLAFDRALVSLAQDQRTVGVNSLETAMTLMRGSAQTGPVVEPIFRAQLTLELLAGDAISTDQAEELLDVILVEPSQEWRRDPLRVLATITTASLPAFERHLELAALRGDQAEILVRMDRLQRQRFYESLPLGGRLLSWRKALSSDPGDRTQEMQQAIARATQRAPQLEATQLQIQSLVQSLKAGPLPIDERQLPGDLKEKYQELVRTSKSHESALAQQALMRIPLGRPEWGTTELAKIQAQLGPEDVVLAFAKTNLLIFGVAIRANQVEYWQVDPQVIQELLPKLLSQIGLANQAKMLPSKINAPVAEWRVTAGLLQDVLLAAPVRDMIQSAERVIIVPSDQLWYLPFELLPDPAVNTQPWVAARAVTYLPTIGSLPRAFAREAPPQETVGLFGSLFAKDRDTNDQSAQTLVDLIPNSVGVSLAEKLAIPSGQWLRIRAPQIWVATNLSLSKNIWQSVPLPLGRSRQSGLGQWLETPVMAPKSILLPGLDTAVRPGQMGNGNDLFLPSCAFVTGGGRSALVSRWTVGGQSSVSLLARYLEGLPHESPSTALRRATLAIWPEDFLIADEPVLLPAGREAAALTAGRHPLLWASYMCIGDSANQ